MKVRMRKLIKAPLLIALTAFAALTQAKRSWAGDVKVIANSSIAADSISPRELRSVFLAEKSRLGGIRVEPVFEKGGAAHEVFLRQYLDQSDSELQTYYRALVVTGRGSMPKALASDEDVVLYVSQTKGAIGYVSLGASTPGVKILAVGGSISDPERKLLTRVEPEYPEALQKRSIGGTVRLRVTIAPNGSVENAELLGGNPVLGDAAIAAVTKWKYSTGPARTTAEVSIPFEPHP